MSGLDWYRPGRPETLGPGVCALTGDHRLHLRKGSSGGWDYYWWVGDKLVTYGWTAERGKRKAIVDAVNALVTRNQA